MKEICNLIEKFSNDEEFKKYNDKLSLVNLALSGMSDNELIRISPIINVLIKMIDSLSSQKNTNSSNNISLSKDDILDDFRNYLEERAVKKLVRSTAKDYANRVSAIITKRKISINDFCEQINDIVEDYSKGGEYEEEGNKSHGAVRAAVIRFADYINTELNN